MNSGSAINGTRVWDSLEEISCFGGTADGGLHRLAASPEDAQARDWFVAQLREIGAAVRIDAVGNIFGRLEPTVACEDTRALLIGSHLDSQPHAGRYDGVYGVIAGLEVLRVLCDQPRSRPIEVVCWTNEEGARFAPAMQGSAVFAGRLDKDAALDSVDADGVTLRDALVAIGYDGDAQVTPAEFFGYVEIHIEQGPILEAEGLDLAVVTGVQGMRWLSVDVGGQRAHAGTTPMEIRKDALVAAAYMIAEVEQIGLSRPAEGRATVGVLTVPDEAPNVVPDRASFVVELRHPHDVDEMAAEVMDAVHRIAQVRGCTARVEDTLFSQPVVFDSRVCDAVSSAIRELGDPVRELVSGAGHDAVQVSHVLPAGMIFIPCINGVSHAPQERITKEWAARGAQALLTTVGHLCAPHIVWD